MVCYFLEAAVRRWSTLVIDYSPTILKLAVVCKQCFWFQENTSQHTFQIHTSAIVLIVVLVSRYLQHLGISSSLNHSSTILLFESEKSNQSLPSPSHFWCSNLILQVILHVDLPCNLEDESGPYPKRGLHCRCQHCLETYRT